MQVTYDFSQQTVIVTGGARGIGEAIAASFVASGADVWIWDVEPVELAGAQSVEPWPWPLERRFLTPPLIFQCERRDLC